VKLVIPRASAIHDAEHAAAQTTGPLAASHALSTTSAAQVPELEMQRLVHWHGSKFPKGHKKQKK
jgi:hypothetical protein